MGTAVRSNVGLIERIYQVIEQGEVELNSGSQNLYQSKEYQDE